jgi:hypothetical protein
MVVDYGKADMTLHVHGTGATEFLDTSPDSRYVCYHDRASVWRKPCMMHTCNCGMNAQCPVCGYGFGAYPCLCDGIMVRREPGWSPCR